MHCRILFPGSFFLLLFLLATGTAAFGQAPRVNTDSLRAARQHVLDSAKAAREAVAAARAAVQKSRTDSLAAIRKYRESRHYRDSVENAREARASAQKAATQARLDSTRAVMQARLDSTRAANAAALETTRAERQRVLDSAKAARDATTAAAREKLKAGSDSLAAARAYRTSKRYTDSVEVVRKSRTDSIKLARAEIAAAATAARQARLDSAVAARKHVLDSATAVRMRISDSIKVVRKTRADSFATAKAAREKLKKKRDEKRIQDMNLAIEVKVKKKRETYSNSQMLKKKWALPRQIVQNTFTRYNWYFNADRRMDEALQNMVRARREGYDSLLTLFPFDPDRDSALLKTDMDSIIQKASLGIQIHDPRTKWGDDLYLLLGQAYFYKGDYDNAAKSFRYILSLRELDKKQREKELAKRRREKGRAAPSILEEEKDGALDFLKHQAVHNEALLWLARTYTESGRRAEAESVLDLVVADPAFPKRLEGRYALERAYIALEAGNSRDAVQHLSAVVADATMPDWLRQRAGYLAGQLAQRRGDYAGAAENYRRTIALKPKVEMDFYARRNLAYCLMEGDDAGAADAIAMLKDLLSDNKYLTYHEQVYFVLGRLSATAGAGKDAETYLRKSIASPKSTRRQKALSFAALGDVYYADASYEAAKIAYDSAAYLGGRTAADPSLILAARRAQTLDAVAIPARTIRTTDSLLTLAAMSERDQLAAVRRYIRSLEQARADSAYRAENAGTAAAMTAEVDSRDGGDGGTWYFANAGLMQQGANEFRRKWGTRPLADNWRRASALTSFAGAANSATRTAAGGAPDGGAGVELDESGLPTEAGLLALIPRGPEALDALRKQQRRAYVDLSDGYIQSLEDYSRATASLDTLDRRYNAHEHGAEALYLRYLAALRQDQMPVAQGHASTLVQRYPESKWAALVRPSSEESAPVASAAGTPAVYYEETYSAMQERRYAEVIQRTREGRRRWADPRYGQRFTIIEATALAGTEQWSAADSLLAAYLASSPADSLKPWAEAVRQYIQRNRPPSPAPGATASAATSPAIAAAASPAPPAPLTAPGATMVTPAATASAPVPASSPTVTPPVSAPASTPAASSIATVPTPPDAPAAFTYNPKEEHYFVFSFGKMEPRAMGVRVGLADFNSFKFSGKSLASSVEMLTAARGLVITRKFADAAVAKAYLKAFRETPQLTREYKSSEYELFVISATNYKKLIADRNPAGYLTFYGKHYK